MADSKVSELTAATSAGGSDLLYLVQTNTSKKITVAALLSSVASNVIPSVDSTYNLGSPSKQWKSLYVSNSTIYIANTPVTVQNNQLIVGSGNTIVNVASESYVSNAIANLASQTYVNTSIANLASDSDLTTANVAEVSNLYFSNSRVYSNVSQIGYISISSLKDIAANSATYADFQTAIASL